MRRLTLGILCNMIIIYHVTAQSAGTINKNTVQEYFQNQQFEEAINYLTVALAADITNMQTLSFLGYAYYMNEDTRNAEKCYQAMLNIDSNNITANQYLAVINNNPYPEKAQLYFHRLVRLQPKKAIFYRNIADLFRRSNEQDSAMAYYKQAYQLAPFDSRNATGLADILISQKKYPSADGILEQVLDKDSLHTIALKLQVRSAYEAKEYQNAIVPGERFIQLNETSITTLTYVLLSYYTLKMYEDCIRVCDYMKARDLASESILYYEARSWARLKDYDKSNELLKTCVSLAISKTAELYYYNLAENYDALKQYKTAIKQYDTAFYLFKNPIMLYYCGSIYESRLKNTVLAKKYYKRYVQFGKPEDAEEKKAYNYVKSKLTKK